MMLPAYLSGPVVPDPDAFLLHLKMLAWERLTEARREYFMTPEPSVPYSYGVGPFKRTYFGKPYTAPVQALQDGLNETYHTDYNVCFLNRYDEGRHQLGWHADEGPNMDDDHPIAVVSFGAVREIWWKEKEAKGLPPEEQRLPLQPGSVFIMPAGFQKTHVHKIPRAGSLQAESRISLTFRRYIP